MSGKNYFKKLFHQKNQKIVVVGLDASGKTTIFYKMKLDDKITTIPTIGFNVEMVSFDTSQKDKVEFVMWDITNGIIFVVDSNDRERISEAHDELHKILSDEQLEDTNLLVFANKQDLPNALSVPEMVDKLNLNSLKQLWFIQPSCAITGEGLYEGFDWIVNAITNNQNYLKLKDVWKSGWSVSKHNVFPKKYRKFVWVLLLISIRKLDIPFDIFLEILSFVNPIDSENKTEMKELVEKAIKKKIL